MSRFASMFSVFFFVALTGCAADAHSSRAAGAELLVAFDASDVASLAEGDVLEIDLRTTGVTYEIDGTSSPVDTAAFEVVMEEGRISLAEWLAGSGADEHIVHERLRIAGDEASLSRFDEPEASEPGAASESLIVQQQQGGGGGTGCPPPYGGGYFCIPYGPCICSGDFNCNRLFCEMDCPGGHGCIERGGVLNCFCRINTFAPASRAVSR